MQRPPLSDAELLRVFDKAQNDSFFLGEKSKPSKSKRLNKVVGKLQAEIERRGLIAPEPCWLMDDQNPVY